MTVISRPNISNTWDLTRYSDAAATESSNTRLIYTDDVSGIHQLIEPDLGSLVVQSNGFV